MFGSQVPSVTTADVPAGAYLLDVREDDEWAAGPEHTEDAYLRAIREGADGLECDVRLTSDGHLVCVHDRRLERTSNGRGVVSEHSLAELGTLDFGSWHPELPDSADDLVFTK